jgi:hypothetical protein
MIEIAVVYRGLREVGAIRLDKRTGFAFAPYWDAPADIKPTGPSSAANAYSAIRAQGLRPFPLPLVRNPLA